jgi:hypothetical protein
VRGTKILGREALAPLAPEPKLGEGMASAESLFKMSVKAVTCNCFTRAQYAKQTWWIFSCATNALLRLPLRVESPARPINAVSAARPSGIKEELQHVNLVVI